VDRIFENLLRDRVRQLLMRGRGGDWGHTLRVVEYGRYLLTHEEGNEEIVIPTLYLHDIGWSAINFDDFRNASPERKRKTMSLSLHMKQGAVLAKKILDDLGYDPQKITTIISIIAIHDEPDKVFAMENPSATLIVEADRMDRYGAESIERFITMFGKDYMRGDQWKIAAARLRKGLGLWFKTKTGKALAEKLARDTGLLI
jgi:HD superfamily phosphodiesterase